MPGRLLLRGDLILRDGLRLGALRDGHQADAGGHMGGEAQRGQQVGFVHPVVLGAEAVRHQQTGDDVGVLLGARGAVVPQQLQQALGGGALRRGRIRVRRRLGLLPGHGQRRLLQPDIEQGGGNRAGDDETLRQIFNQCAQIRIKAAVGGRDLRGLAAFQRHEDLRGRDLGVEVVLPEQQEIDHGAQNLFAVLPEFVVQIVVQPLVLLAGQTHDNDAPLLYFDYFSIPNRGRSFN